MEFIVVYLELIGILFLIQFHATMLVVVSFIVFSCSIYTLLNNMNNDPQ